MKFFQKYLSVWVILCMIIGVFAGHSFPMIPNILNKFEYAGISIPMAVLIWIMIYPMMIGTTSAAALATTVGVLTEVPVMLMLVRIANKTKGRFL